MIGATISHYKIIKKLGQGGMGIVYQAQDTKLDRLVALKFLPHHLSESKTEQARFMQEAKAASALNHPNVCTIHYIEEIEQQQFIVMEHVDGMTLREKFEDAPLKLNDALAYAVQIGEALQEAHSKGIVHRDIKSDNIMVNSKNQIKVMDFGLAKLKGSLKLTRSSSTVGTLSYMAPEQLQGDEADARSDIFSFGVVVYEMLTQHTPFRGEHEAAIVYSIVNEAPEPIEKYRSDLPDDLMRILRRAFEKDKEDRYQSIADMVSELRRLRKETSKISHSIQTKSFAKKELTTQGAGEASEQATPAPSPGKSKGSRWLTAALFLLVIAGIIYILLPKLTPYIGEWLPRHQTERVISLNPNSTFKVLQVAFTQIGVPGLSPDGNWIAFPAIGADNSWDIYYMNVSGGEPRRITSDSSSQMVEADISPEGGRIVYDRWNQTTGKSEVCIVSALGGISTKIAENGIRAHWRSDGERIGYLVKQQGTTTKTDKVELRSVRPDGGDSRIEFSEGAITVGEYSSFAFSPDGKSAALARTFPSGYQEIFINELGSGMKRQVTFDEKNIGDLYWSRGDDILFSSEKGGNANLWAIPAGGGSEVQITKGSGPDVSMKLSGDGKKLLYLQQQRLGRCWILDSAGAGARQLPLGDRDLRAASLSPDALHIAMQIADPNPLTSISHVYLSNLDGSSMRQISVGRETVTEPRWSPDGRWIAYSSRTPTSPAESSFVYLADAVNPATPKLIGMGMELRWIDSGTLIVYDGTRSWQMSPEGDEKKQFYDDYTEAIPVQDGRYILFRDHRSNRDGWWLVSSSAELEKDSAQAAFDSMVIGGPPVPPDYNDSGATPRSRVIRTPKYILPDLPGIALGNGGRFLLFTRSTGEIKRLSLPDGLEQSFSGMVSGRDIRMSVCDDGKIVYIESRLSSKMVIVENLF